MPPAQKSYWLVRLGRGNAFAREGYEENFVGVGFLHGVDLTPFAGHDFRRFQEEMVPRLKHDNPEKSKVALGLNSGNLWTVVCGMKVADIVVVPMGDGVFQMGEVIGGYRYRPDSRLPHQREVRWVGSFNKAGISKPLANSIGSIMTAFNVTKHQKELEGLMGGEDSKAVTASDETVESIEDFGIESHLEDFLIHNWGKTELGKDYDIYEEDGEQIGQQYVTEIGRIDILAKSKRGKEWLIVELKKGRSSDVVIGQLLRYMGYVKQNLAEAGEEVTGMIVAGEDDERLRYALSVTRDVRYMVYRVHFRLEEMRL